MNAKSKIESIKKHILENKKVYIGTALGLAAGRVIYMSYNENYIVDHPLTGGRKRSPAYGRSQ